MTRRKSDKLPAAQSREEAISLLGRFAVIQAGIDARNAQADKAIAEIRAAVNEADSADEKALKAIFNQVKPWWSVAGHELTEGKRKAVELGGCHVGTRKTTPKLAFEDVTEAEALDTLQGWGMSNYIRTKIEINKQAVLAALTEAGWRAVVMLSFGFRSSQKEEFFIAPIPPIAPAVEVIAEAPAEQVLS